MGQVDSGEAHAAAIAQQDAAAAGAAKLKEMLGGKLPPEKKAPIKPAADAGALPPEMEAKRRELTRALASRDLKPEDRETKLRELRAILAQGQTQEEMDAYANLPIAEMRDAVGVRELFGQLPAPLRNTWSEDSEAEYLAAFNEQGVAPAVVKSLYAWYVDTRIGNGGQFQPRHAEEFRALAKRHEGVHREADQVPPRR